MPEAERPFDFLVVGDSLIWGQGLEEKDKFYALTKNWLENEFFGGRRRVALKMKAHSGATIFLHDDEAAALKKTGRTENTFFDPEVAVGFLVGGAGSGGQVTEVGGHGAQGWSESLNRYTVM